MMKIIRFRWKGFGLGYLAIFLVILVACAQKQGRSTDVQEPLVERMQIHMGTEISISLPKSDLALADLGFETFRQFDEALSTYKPTSELSQLNSKGSVRGSTLLRASLLEAIEVASLTGGQFDPTIGVLSETLYAFQRPKERVPSRHELKEKLYQVDYRKIAITNEKVSLPRGWRIDLGGIAKGQAVDAAVERMKAQARSLGQELNRGIVAASGDLRCFHPCEVVVRHPLREGQAWARLHLIDSDMSVSTSGVSERKVRGTLRNHLLDPKTGQSETRFYSVTLFARAQNGRLDGLTTGVALMSLDEALRFLAVHSGLKYILLTSQGEAWVSPDQDAWSRDWVLSNANDFKIRQATHP